MFNFSSILITLKWQSYLPIIAINAVSIYVYSKTWFILLQKALDPCGEQFISPWVHMRNLSPLSKMKKGQRSWGRVLVRNSRKKATRRNTNLITFAPTIALVTLKIVSLQLNGMLMMWKIQQAMQDDAI